MLSSAQPTEDVEIAEHTVAEAIGKSMGISSDAPAPTLTATVTAESYDDGSEKFSFDAEFQTKIAALAIRDTSFNNKTSGLVKPAYFENAIEAKLVDISLNYFKDYKKSPDLVTLGKLLKDAIGRKLIRSDLVPDLKLKLSEIVKANITDSAYAASEIVKFAKHSEMSIAIMDSVDLLGLGKYDEIEKKVKSAISVGLNESANRYNYFEEAKTRANIRRDTLSGLIKPNGITTGIKLLDSMLHHGGWGRKELVSLLGGAKVGKSTALMHFGRVACFAGHNIIYFTLEMSPEIIGDRLDASISGVNMDVLDVHLNEIEEKITSLYESKSTGLFQIHAYSSGTMKASDVRKTLDLYAAEGVKFDMVIIDYADIMAPEQRNADPIENSKNIYLDIRAIAQEYDVAMLTATQTNRTGFTAATSKAEHASEDFNKVRIVDLMISLNRTEEEIEKNEARLYFAASRNQKGNFSIRVEQDLEKMRFITKVLGVI